MKDMHSLYWMSTNELLYSEQLLALKIICLQACSSVKNTIHRAKCFDHRGKRQPGPQYSRFAVGLCRIMPNQVIIMCPKRGAVWNRKLSQPRLASG